MLLRHSTAPISLEKHNTICSLYIGLLVKEKNSRVHKITTYFSKVVIDQKWDTATLTTFNDQLVKCNISVKTYPVFFKHETNATITEIEIEIEIETEEDDDSMDAAPCREDIVTSSTLPPRVAIQTTVSSGISLGFNHHHHLHLVQNHSNENKSKQSAFSQQPTWYNNTKGCLSASFTTKKEKQNRTN
jgi:hypothetical protein